MISRCLLVLTVVASALGCASYQTELDSSIRDIRNNQPAAAAERLKAKAYVEGDDQVVYLFEYATAKQLSGDFKESNTAFLKAEELTDIKDYHSLSRVTGSLLLNQGMVQYKGEDYEKVLINAMLAINFLAIGDREAALVETRKVNDKLYKYKFEAKRDYQQNPFAFYLAAMIWETNRHWDDAYIDYKRVFELNPNIPYIAHDLLRLSRLSRRQDEWANWVKQFPEQAKEIAKRSSAELAGQSEIVLLFQQGWAPRKKPHPEQPRLPKLYPVPSRTRQARLVVNGVGEQLSQEISSVQDVAIKTLDDQYTALKAKRAAGLVTKAVVSDQLRQKNELLGQLAWLGMNLADQADLRQWVTLPQSFQVARVALKPGKYTVYIEGLDDLGQPSGERSADMSIVVKARQKVFIPWRSLQ